MLETGFSISQIHPWHGSCPLCPTELQAIPAVNWIALPAMYFAIEGPSLARIRAPLYPNKPFCFNNLLPGLGSTRGFAGDTPLGRESTFPSCAKSWSCSRRSDDRPRSNRTASKQFFKSVEMRVSPENPWSSPSPAPGSSTLLSRVRRTETPQWHGSGCSELAS